MAYVIAAPCIDVKDGACTAVCPVDCIYEGGRMFYIQPEECINCGLCLSICPVDAIAWDGALDPEREPFVEINRDFFSARVSGLGAPGGWDPNRSTVIDHPVVASWPRGGYPRVKFAARRS